jgi:hypothetical protein
VLIDRSATGIPETQKAFALLGGVLLRPEGLAEVFDQFDEDEGGSMAISLEDFVEGWTLWSESEMERLEFEYGATKAQALIRGHLARRMVQRDHGFTFTGDLELHIPEGQEHAASLMYHMENGENSEWLTIPEVLDLCLEGVIDDSTKVWTEGAYRCTIYTVSALLLTVSASGLCSVAGMEFWVPLAQCKSRFGLGEDEYPSDEEEIDYEEMINEFVLEVTLECALLLSVRRQCARHCGPDR